MPKFPEESHVQSVKDGLVLGSLVGICAAGCMAPQEVTPQQVPELSTMVGDLARVDS